MRRKRPFQSIRGRVIRIGLARRPTGNAAERMTGSSEAIDLRAQGREKGLRLSELGELLGRWEALDRRAPARRVLRRRDWPRDKASPETARRAVRSCALFATARQRSRPAMPARPARYW